jgi:glycosyltransferase involved in cell wall biosynthesis
MHILFLNPVGKIGGAEQVLYQCIESVRSLRETWQTTVVMLSDGPLRAAVEEAGARCVIVPLPKSLARAGDTGWRSQNKLRQGLSLSQHTLVLSLPVLRFSLSLRRMIKSLKPDLIHSNGLKTHVFARLVHSHKTPTVWHVHDFYSARPAMARMLRFMTSGVATGIAISKAVADDVHRVLPKLPIELIRNAVSLCKFRPDGSIIDLDELAGLPIPEPDVLRVGLVATYANWKGHDIFIRSIARLADDFPLLRGYIIGEPIYATRGSQFSRQELSDLAKSLNIADRIGFIPFQRNTADTYRSLDIVAHTSTRPEPFGLTIAEAMACGRAVIVSNSGGAAELFTEGHDAVGHSPGDINGLSAAMRRLLLDPELRFALGKNARITAEKQFSSTRFAHELVSTYEGLIGESDS